MREMPLKGLRVIESSLLEPGSVAMTLAALGADVIKVEAADGHGDYSRELGWPMVEGISILHWHLNQGKRSIVLDLRKPEGRDVYLELVRKADVVVEGMRPGALARRGLGYEALAAANPKIVMCTLSGYGMTGPYKDMPSHGVGFDAWGSCAPPVTDENGFVGIPPMPSVGTRTGAIWAALSILAAVMRAGREGRGAQIDIGQADCAAFTNWVVLEAYQAYKRPEPEVTGNPSDGGQRRAPGTEGSKEGVRYQYYRTRDGHVLFMASEREFWENFCRGVGRADLYEKRPGNRYADHALGDHELRRELQGIFGQRTTAEWIAFGLKVNTPIMVVNNGQTVLEDPQFKHRFPWLPAAEHGADLMPIPVKFVGEELAAPRRAPTLGQHNAEVLAEVLGYGPERIDALRKAGVLG